MTATSGSAAKLSADKERTHEQKLRHLYLLAFARQPTDGELATATAYIEKKGDKPKEKEKGKKNPKKG